MSTLRELSRSVFGNSYRLEVLAAVAQFERPFFARELAAQLGVADNLISAQLQRLADVGLLERCYDSGSRGSVNYYQSLPTPLWRAATDLVEHHAEAGRRHSSSTAMDLRVEPSDPIEMRELIVAGLSWTVDIITKAKQVVSGASDGTRFSDQTIGRGLTRLVTHLADVDATRPSASSIVRIASQAGIANNLARVLLLQPLDLITMVTYEWAVRAGYLEPATVLRLEIRTERSSVRNVFGVENVAGVPVLQTLVLWAETSDSSFALAQLPLVTGTRWDPNNGDWVEGPRYHPSIPLSSSFAEHVDLLAARLALFHNVLGESHLHSEALPRHLPIVVSFRAPSHAATQLADRLADGNERLEVLACLARNGQHAVVEMDADGLQPRHRGSLIYKGPDGDQMPISELAKKLTDGERKFVWLDEAINSDDRLALAFIPGGIEGAGGPVSLFVAVSEANRFILASNFSVEVQPERATVIAAARALAGTTRLPELESRIGSLARSFETRQGTAHLAALIGLISAARAPHQVVLAQR